ncbi:MAG: hypothetical protein A2X61_10580 [Ignavibacteria bacterium GWB2_35_12]|nr:MAG: hypothetical protein A2X63_01880 [Ignavibacteria bacterium GWA2_35_8]OGU42679.1 MAG: hypothetical protein A2X61_10580 [Ignavibacteria bacterium GWB2_35_12]OGU89385.1 MAG: hypothetical protein A2220_01185 [Ignavibacteria bacterium RIFOXYA2_FULL_35_10]OGV22756.1 MAG: hypothetical protein A2475_05435 [Ignavibacteria bacterium RIFOXYC2_FULL_35_21]
MKLILLFIFLLTFSIFANAKTISSTKTGGEWNNPKTWVKGKVPTENDNAIIKGEVVIKTADTVHKITIQKNAKLVVDNTEQTSFLVKTIVYISGKLEIKGIGHLRIWENIKKTKTGVIDNRAVIEVGQ